MEKKRLITKGIGIGIVLFIITHILSHGYALLVTKLVPSGSSYTHAKYLLTATTEIVYWIGRPLSHIFWFCCKDFVSSSATLSQNSVLILRGLDVIFWIGVGILILYIKAKKQTPATK